MNIEGLLTRDGVAASVRVNSKRQALVVAADVAARACGRGPGEVQAALLEREQAGATGLGAGVALPHARLEGLPRPYGAFVRLETPVDFEAMDEQPVDLIFALLTPKTDVRREHLKALAGITRMLRRPALREQLRQAQTADAIHALLAGEAQSSAA